MDDNRKTEKLLARLRVRGIDVSTDPDFMKIVPWTRFTFALCTIAAAVATAMASTLLLWAMVLIATLGAATTRHPFDHIYNKVVRRFTGTSELPENRAPTRFACGMAAVWFTCVALAFHAGYDATAYTLGVMFVGVGALVSVTHFCIPSTIYQFLFGDRSLIKPSIFGKKEE